MGNTPHFLRRGPRRFGLLEIPTWGCGAMENFESGTLDGGGEPYIGWLGGGKVTLWGGTAAYEDFETGTLSGGGADFGWSATGLVYFSVTVAITGRFMDLSSTGTIVATVSGSGSFTYQWFQGGMAMTNGGEYSGVTTNTLTITGVTNPDYTTYYCQATSLGTTMQSNTVTLIDRASDWKNRALLIGGNPSGPTVTALRTFWNGLVSDGASSPILSLNAMVPDDIPSMQTPFVVGPGLDPWVNHGFAIGDLTVNGLVGNSTTKYLETGFVPSTAGSNLGCAFYTVSLAGSTGCNLSGVSASTFFQAIAKYSDGHAYFYDNGNGVVVASPPNLGGFYAQNRVSATDHRAWFANSTHAFAQIGSTDAAAFGSYTSFAVEAFANNASGTIQQFSGDRQSFAVFYSLMTSTQLSNLYNRTQTLRTSLGGGFI
jgi:hypothetical protein